MNKKILTTAAIVLLTSASCGSPYTIDYRAKEEFVTSYMSEKYGENFTIAAPTGSELTWQPKDDPFREFYITRLTSPDGKEYTVYHDDDETHTDLWIIGDDFMMPTAEPYITEFLAESLAEYSPCADTCLRLMCAGSSDIHEKTSAFTNRPCFGANYPLITSREDFLNAAKDTYINVAVYVPDSEQSAETVDDDWKRWRDYIHEKFNKEADLSIEIVDSESYFAADGEEKYMDFNHIYTVPLH